MQPTSLEVALLDWLSTNLTVPCLFEQLKSVSVANRQFTGAGSYTHLYIPNEVPSLPNSYRLRGADGPIEGPEIESPELPCPACTLLWFSNRRLSLLEIASPSIIESHPATFKIIPISHDDA